MATEPHDVRGLTCRMCEGLGQCFICLGSGRDRGDTCGACGGDGVCGFCEGEGEVSDT